MKVFIVVAAFLVATISAKPSGLLTEFPTFYTAASAPILSQYHSQDSLGQYSYGYNGGLSSKVETKTLDGITRGSYSYVDAENRLQTVEYTADAVNGFRAAATNLPKAPIDTNVAPQPIELTPEVARATAEHMTAFKEIASRNDVEPELPIVAEVKSIAPIAPIAPIARIEPISTYNAFAPIANFAPASYFTYKTEEHPAAFSYSYNAPAATYAYSAGPATFYTHTMPLQHNFAFGQPAIFARAATPIAYEPQTLTQVSDTVEVAAAKAEHLAAVEEQKARIANADQWKMVQYSFPNLITIPANSEFI